MEIKLLCRCKCRHVFKQKRYKHNCETVRKIASHRVLFPCMTNYIYNQTYWGIVLHLQQRIMTLHQKVLSLFFSSFTFFLFEKFMAISERNNIHSILQNENLVATTCVNLPCFSHLNINIINREIFKPIRHQGKEKRF